ncbi:MAG: hypothetical protein AB7Y74_02770 [Syntrophorhabdus sp.]
MVKLAYVVLFIVLLAFLMPGISVAAKTQPGWAVLVIDVQSCFVQAEDGALAVYGNR